MKRIVALIMACVMSAALLAACGSSGSGSPSAQTASAQAQTNSAEVTLEGSEAQSGEMQTEAASETASETAGEEESSQAQAQNTDVNINVVAMSGPTGMGMAYLNEQSDNGNTAYRYNISYASAPDEVTGGLISGEIQIAALPVNLASVLYNKTDGEILTAAVNTLGVLYIVEKGDSIHSLSDLAGKKILASGQGSTPEYVLAHLLEKNGLTDKVEVEYVTEHDEAVTALAAGTADIIMIPEPKVTAALSQVEGARIAVDLTGEWDKVSDGTMLVQGVIVMQKSFVNEHPEIADQFLIEYADSVGFTNSNMEEAAQLIEKYGIIPKAPVALKALPNCNIVMMSGEEMTESVTAMLETLYAANPQSIGGSLPGEDMFYISE